ncbi:MAG: hypothetical protein HY730_07970, partial [Candidatus Tectomicrobia bacterium]|nr:hypothetical protein [Candidatus Tectomicrobia bacterium]
KLEPGKVDYYPHLEPVHKLVKIDLDRALLEFFNSQISYFELKHFRVHSAMLEARGSLQLKLA